MKNVKTRDIATLGVLVVVLAAILTEWQGTISINGPAVGLDIDSRLPIAINQAN
jgi:hypothetical protein